MALYRQTLWAFYHVMFRTCAEYPGIAIVLTFPVKSKKLCAEPKLAQHGTEICNNARVCAYAYGSAFVFGCHCLRVRKLGCSVYDILLKQIIKVKHENRTYLMFPLFVFVWKNGRGRVLYWYGQLVGHQPLVV